MKNTSLNEALHFVVKLVTPTSKAPERASRYLEQPWPRPSPRLPDRLPPRVMNVPKQEIQEFFKKVVSRYKKALL